VVKKANASEHVSQPWSGGDEVASGERFSRTSGRGRTNGSSPGRGGTNRGVGYAPLELCHVRCMFSSGSLPSQLATSLTLLRSFIGSDEGTVGVN
jgi:hypothetical protein